MARIAVRVSGGSECQASITLASSGVIGPLPVSGAASGAAPSAKRPFSSGFRGVGSGLQIRHPGFEFRRRLSCSSAVSDGKRASNASDSFDLGSSAFFVAHCGWSHPVAVKSGVSRPARCAWRCPQDCEPFGSVFFVFGSSIEENSRAAQIRFHAMGTWSTRV